MSSRATARPVDRPEPRFAQRIYLPEVLRGLGVTSRHFFVNLRRHIRAALGRPTEPGAVTIQYPEQPPMLGRRARVRHRLLKRADGTPRCVACMLCETVCPADCIRIVAEESADATVEKRAKSFDIDLGLCVFCGYCVEVCPVDAIRMDSGRIDLCAFSRRDLVWRMDELMGDREKAVPFVEGRDPLEGS